MCVCVCACVCVLFPRSGRIVGPSIGHIAGAFWDHRSVHPKVSAHSGRGVHPPGHRRFNPKTVSSYSGRSVGASGAPNIPEPSLQPQNGLSTEWARGGQIPGPSGLNIMVGNRTVRTGAWWAHSLDSTQTRFQHLGGQLWGPSLTPKRFRHIVGA